MSINNENSVNNSNITVNVSNNNLHNKSENHMLSPCQTEDIEIKTPVV